MMMNMKQSVEFELEGETEVFGKKRAPMPLRPTQIPHDMIWARTRRVTALAMAMPFLYLGHRMQTGFGTTQSLNIQEHSAGACS
jgi:hypothetical protein